MSTMIRVSVDPSKTGHMMTEGKRVTITQPTYSGPDKITFYVECACGHSMGRRMTAVEAQAAMTPDGLIPYDGLCFECDLARYSRYQPGEAVELLTRDGWIEGEFVGYRASTDEAEDFKRVDVLAFGRLYAGCDPECVRYAADVDQPSTWKTVGEPESSRTCRVTGKISQTWPAFATDWDADLYYECSEALTEAEFLAVKLADVKVASFVGSCRDLLARDGAK